MDLRSIANQASNTINGNLLVSVLQSAGYTVGAGHKQVPSYLPPVTGYAQIQAMDSEDLRQVAGLNLQGQIKALYIRGSLFASLRPIQKGGDLVQITNQTTGAVLASFLIVEVLEGWKDWTKVAIVLQEPS